MFTQISCISYTHIHINTYIHTSIHIHTHTYTYIYIHTYTYMYIHIHIHTHIHTYMEVHAIRKIWNTYIIVEIRNLITRLLITSLQKLPYCISIMWLYNYAEEVVHQVLPLLFFLTEWKIWNLRQHSFLYCLRSELC